MCPTDTLTRNNDERIDNMHGDDVASASIQIVGTAAKETITLLFQAIMKMIENHQQNERFAKELEMKYADIELPEINGEQRTLSALKKGGELVNATIPKEDFEAFKKANMEYDIPYTAFPIKDSDMVDVYILKSDEAVFKPMLDRILQDKMAAPEQQYKMTLIDKDKAEAFQIYCAKKNISINMLENETGQVKCIYKADSELKVKTALEHIEGKKNELSKVSVDIEMKGNKPQFVINDIDKGRKIRFNFGTKERFEKAMTENLSYPPEKAKLASQAVAAKLSPEQRKAFLSGSKITEKIDKMQRDIRFTDDSLLVGGFEFTALKLSGSSESNLIITDKEGNMALIPESMKNRDIIENTLRRDLGLSNNEQIKDMMKKIEKTGFAEKPKIISKGEYDIIRTSKNTAEVALGDKTVTIDLTNRKSAKKTLSESFNIDERKSDTIIDKASKQSTTKSILNKAKQSMPDVSAMIREKKQTRGSRK